MTVRPRGREFTARSLGGVAGSSVFGGGVDPGFLPRLSSQVDCAFDHFALMHNEGCFPRTMYYCIYGSIVSYNVKLLSVCLRPLAAFLN